MILNFIKKIKKHTHEKQLRLDPNKIRNYVPDSLATPSRTRQRNQKITEVLMLSKLYFFYSGGKLFSKIDVLIA